MPMPFFTIGHSTRSTAEFAELLRASDYLICAGESVFHILGKRVDRAVLTPGAIRHADGTVTYPPLVAEKRE
jgi:hypothetical protein